jgi:uncharacterized repeat protein (TIGR04042 family)
MPEMHFLVEWPNGTRENCYSPSYVVEEYITEGQDYPVSDFVERVGRALHVASERVRARYGFACSSALDQLARLESVMAELSAANVTGPVKVLAFDKHPPRDARTNANY